MNRVPFYRGVTGPELGKLGFLGGGCCADLLRSGVGVLVAPRGKLVLFLEVPRRIWHVNGTVPSRRTFLGGVGVPECSEPQPTTVSQDDGSVDRARVCVPR